MASSPLHPFGMPAEHRLPLEDRDLLGTLAANDSSWRGALHILCSEHFASHPDVWRHVRIKERCIYFEEMLEETHFSGEERLLLETAWNLFNGGTQVSLDDLACYLGESALRLIFAAMRKRAAF